MPDQVLHRLELELTDEELTALGYALGCGLGAATRDRKEATRLRLVDIHGKIHRAAAQGALEAANAR